MTARTAILEADVSAFEWTPPHSTGIAPMLCFRVGHFAVCKRPESLVVLTGGRSDHALGWFVAHVASGAMMLDFATRDAAWRFADEISRACGERLEHEPKNAAEFCAAVPDVVRWVRWLSVQPLTPRGERPFVPEPTTNPALDAWRDHSWAEARP